MKQKIGTLVLFTLTLLTIAALTKVEAPQATAIGSLGQVKRVTN